MSIMRIYIVTLVGLFLAISGSSLFAQNAWETLPVFHGGRVMPLHSFAQQIVREICGTTRPFIIRDDAAVAEFNQILGALRQRGANQQEDSTGYRYLNPDGGLSSGGFSRPYSILGKANEVLLTQKPLLPQNLDPAQIERLSDRFKQLIPAEGRYFQADELLLLWIAEPEVWTYIPIFLVPESDYLDEIFGVSFKGDARTSQYRISLYQMEQSLRFKQRCAEIQKRHELGQFTASPILFDQITERLENQSRVFQELTFHPQRQRPTRMLSMLNQIAGLTGEHASYASALDAWAHLLALGEVPERQTTERTPNPNDRVFLHPTTQRWHAVADQMRFIMLIYDRTDNAGNPILPRATLVEQQYEILIDLIETNLAESAALMEAVYPGTSDMGVPNDHRVDVKRLLPKFPLPNNEMPSNQSQNRREILQSVICYHCMVKTIRNDVEAAYLALYDNGRSLRFLPLLSPHVMELASSQDNFGVQPWASAQMILGSGHTFVKRFFDPQYDILPEKLSPAGENSEGREPTEETTDKTTENAPDPTATNISAPDPDSDLDAAPDALPPANNKESNNNENKRINIAEDDPADETPKEQKALLKLLFMPSEIRGGILQLKQDDRSAIGNIRNRLNMLQSSFASLIGEHDRTDFRSSSGEYGNTDFRLRAQDLAECVYSAATSIEVYRKSLFDEKNRKKAELFTKTAYPDDTVKLRAEYWYDRMHPFFWMGILAMLAMLLNGSAYVTAAARDKSVMGHIISIHSIVHGKEEETTLSDYTNTVEEWLFFASVIMLSFSILIAFSGAVLRAVITGWAPVTNMYETVVMMAFATAVLGIWYGLYPLLHPALQRSWNYSQFPRISTLSEWLTAMKAHKSIHRSQEPDGSATLRQAAMELGISGGREFGGLHTSSIQWENPAEVAALQRVKVARRKITAQCLMALPRLILTFVILYGVVWIANGEYLVDNGLLSAVANMLTTTDVIDSLTVSASVLLIVWLTPHVFMTLLLTPLVLMRPAWIAAEMGICSYTKSIIIESGEQQVKKQQATRQPHSEMSGIFRGEAQGPQVSARSHDTSGRAWLKQARNAVLDRKLFIAVTAGIVFITSLIAMANRAEFNPDIRPIAAVLRSNFWLTIHVIAIIVSYAAAFAAWGMAVVSLGYTIFGRYQRAEGEWETQKMRVLLPEACQLYAPIIERLIKIAMLLLIVGTVLGARWADYSWGRFWSWDPKEVWALITILFYAIIFHGKAARYYGTIGITVGALCASIAVIFTWYGINFVFQGSVHAYGGGTSVNATIFLFAFITANILWGALALLRYNAEIYGNEAE